MQGNRIEVKLINLGIALSQRYKQSLKKNIYIRPLSEWRKINFFQDSTQIKNENMKFSRNK